MRPRSKRFPAPTVSPPAPVPDRTGRSAAQNGMPPEQAKVVQELIDLLKGNNLAELEVERAGFRIRLRRETAPAQVITGVREAAAPTAESPAHTVAVPEPGASSGLVTIQSPIVGTFYRSPSPDADPYVEEGDVVKKGQVLCVVEAMKLMNEIESETDGRVARILAESGKPVEYGQPLFLIDPSAAS